MANYVDMTASAVEHLESMASQHPDLAADYYTPMATFCRSKLWHQLTLKVTELVTSPKTVRSTSDGTHSYLALYDKVVLAVATKLNALSVAKIASHVANAMQPTDATAARAVLENLVAQLKQQSTTVGGGGDASTPATPSPALIYLQSKLVSLQLATATGQDVQLPALKTTLDGNKPLLDAVDETNPATAAVHAAHYEASMAYYKLVGPPEAFYEQAMAFLQYAPPGTPNTTTNYHQLAVDLVLAALTGDGVYNLGQVEQNPILTVLKETPDAWLVDLLHTCAAGDVTRFAQVSQQHAVQIAAQPALTNRATAVQEKMKLIALVWLIFSKPPHERVLEFSEIAEALQVPVEQVEWVLMRAMSVKLIEGKLDQIDQTVDITWILPRVLNTQQMTDLAKRFDEWAESVKTTETSVKQQAAPVLG
mmetsp:Transcript_24623/g.46836  ORF Transcript_24623/g.46836 Transcript_24623/m.46836 type:complete len:422 (-) Transcript_24623:72-1337(-)|eukprot:scaffold6586_cov138-Amphora_coffeaeformis.AAC.3